MVKSYIQEVYNDFEGRLTWYYMQNLLSFTQFADIKNRLDRSLAMAKNGMITQREAVMLMTATFIDNNMR